MRLIDRRQVPARQPWEVEHESRLGFGPLPASGASIRYILDPEASKACGELVRSGEGLFEADNPLFRMPADSFWVELFEEPAGKVFSGPLRRVGYLVEAAPEGRSGSILAYWETDDGLSRCLPCQIVFDLERRITRRPGMYALRHPNMPHLAALLEHCLLRPDTAGMRQLTPGPGTTVLGELAEGTWFALPLLFAFVALLNSPQLVETRRSDLVRLNRARARRGRTPLLDHVEVRLALGETSGGSGSAHNPLRTTPRLHFVRGHVVHREGKTFWRQAHLRGDSHKAIVSKTVRVTAGRSVRRDATHHVRMAVNGR